MDMELSGLEQAGVGTSDHVHQCNVTYKAMAMERHMVPHHRRTGPMDGEAGKACHPAPSLSAYYLLILLSLV